MNSILKCTYCDEEGHNIYTCTKDLYLENIFDIKPMPDFFKMSNRIKKKLAVIIGEKPSLPTSRLSIIFIKKWNEINKEVVEVEECSVCYEKLKKTNVCTTKCGHKFCLECILRTRDTTNKCPLCREELCKKEKFIIEAIEDLVLPLNPDIRSDLIGNFQENRQENEYLEDTDIYTDYRRYHRMVSRRQTITANMFGVVDDIER